MEKIYCAQFIDGEDEYIDNYIQESYHDDSFNTDTLFTLLKRRALDQGYELLDIDDFDYDHVFSIIYNCTEKGLS